MGNGGRVDGKLFKKENVFFHHSRGNTFGPVKKRNIIKLGLYVKM